MEHWYWVICGLVLIAMEMFIPAFVFLVAGISALVIAIMSWFFPLSFNMQLIFWLGYALLFSLLWFKFLKPFHTDKTKSGLGGTAAIGEVGIIVTPPIENDKGKVRFSVPILGSDEWVCRSDDNLKSGDRVRVIKIIGNELLVTKTDHQ